NPTVTGTTPGVGLDGVVAVYAPEHRMVYFHDRGRLFRYDPAANNVTSITGTYSTGTFGSGVWDPRRQRYLIFGTGSQTGQAGTNQVAWVNLVNGDTAAANSRSFAFNALTGAPSCSKTDAPGAAYDQAQDRYVLWCGGNAVNVIDPDTFTA